jgi:hypothetical protein
MDVPDQQIELRERESQGGFHGQRRLRVPRAVERTFDEETEDFARLERFAAAAFRLDFERALARAAEEARREELAPAAEEARREDPAPADEEPPREDLASEAAEIF